MKKIIIIAALFAACKKEEPIKPTSTKSTTTQTVTIAPKLLRIEQKDGSGNQVKVNGNIVQPPLNVKINDKVEIVCYVMEGSVLNPATHTYTPDNTYQELKVYLDGVLNYTTGCKCDINYNFTVK